MRRGGRGRKKKMQVQSKLSLRQFINYSFTVNLRNPWVMIMMTLMVVVMIMFAYLTISHPETRGTIETFGLIFPVFMLTYLPGMVYFGARKRFHTNKRMQEKMIFDFTPKKISITGQTFKMEMDWNKLHSVKELGGWILLYQNAKMANVIPVESFGNQLNDFKDLVKKIPGVKYKFK